MHRLRPGLLAFVLSTLLAHSALAAGQDAATPVVLEEVVAVVGRTPILRSDLELAALVELDHRSADESGAAFRSRLLDLRIRLELQFRDLEATGILYRLEPPVASVVEQLAEAGGGRERLEERMARYGLGWSDLEDLALRIAATRAYVEQRLRSQLSVTDEEVEEAYQQLAEETRRSGHEVPALGEVEAQLHRLVTERKLNREIELWLDQARERLEVIRYAP